MDGKTCCFAVILIAFAAAAMRGSEHNDMFVRGGDGGLGERVRFRLDPRGTLGCHQRRCRSPITDQRRVAGVGNIYASETLFLAGIHPRRAAGRIAQPRYEALAKAIKTVLQKAIKAGGTTLRDFYGGNGEAGYFKQQLEVYGREDEPCKQRVRRQKSEVQSPGDGRQSAPLDLCKLDRYRKECTYQGPSQNLPCHRSVRNRRSG